MHCSRQFAHDRRGFASSERPSKEATAGCFVVGFRRVLTDRALHVRGLGTGVGVVLQFACLYAYSYMWIGGAICGRASAGPGPPTTRTSARAGMCSINCTHWPSKFVA